MEAGHDNTCTECGAQLSSRTLQGACPACIARLTFDVTAESAAYAGSGGGIEFGNYELIEEIGRGGMGVVHKARQRNLNRVVALKTILAGRFASSSEVERFRFEAQAAATLRHPNIVAIHEVGQFDGQHYFSMEHVAGHSLADLVHEADFTIYDFKRSALWVKILAEAIHYAHGCGVLHRDLKPSNVLIDEHDQPRITDFGLAKRLNNPSDLTLSGKAIGSPSFIPPEQSTGNRSAIGPHSDVYGLGAVLYYLLTGRAPFAAETLELTLSQVLQNDPVAPRALNLGVPRDLETICLKCLEKEPARRYQTAQQLADELRRFIANEPILVRPISPVEKLWRWSRRRPAVAGLLAALAVSLVAGFGAVLWQWQRAEGHAEAEAQQRRRAEALVEDFELRHVDDLLRANDAGPALTRLARVLRRNPTHRLAAEKAVAAMAQRPFAVPVFPELQHGGAVNDLDLSRDGRWLVTVSNDGTARLWDAHSGQPIGAMMRHAGPVNSARFSFDSRKVVTASTDKTARIWNARTGEPLTHELTHEAGVNTAEFNLDDRWIVTACSNGVARLWNAVTGEPERDLSRHQRPVTQAHFSADGNFVVSVGHETVQLVNIATGEQRPLRHAQFVRTAEFSPDSRSLVTASWDGSTRIWEVPRGELRLPPLRESQGFEVWAASFSPDGRYVASAIRDGTTRLWDATTGRQVGNPFPHATGPMAARFSPDGERLATVAMDNGVYIWNIATGTLCAQVIKHPGPVTAVRFSLDGQRLFTASKDGKARVWDLRSGVLQSARLPYGAVVRFAHFSPDGTRVVASSNDGRARVWNVQTGRAHSPWMLHTSWVNKAWFNRDGTKVLTASLDRTLGLWDASTAQRIFPALTNSGAVRYGCFSPDNRLVAAACDDGMLQLWSAETGQPDGEPLRHPRRLWYVDFSADGQRLATACGDSTARLWDLRTRKLIAEPLQHSHEVNIARFSRDGARIVTASADHTARLWDGHTGQPLSEPLQHHADVRDAVFSRDGRWVATASADNTARVFETATGRPQVEPLRHNHEVHSVQFSADGRRLLTGSFDGAARVWDWAAGRLACEPFRHTQRVFFATFSPDERRIATASADGTARLWEVPLMRELPPSWLPDLAEAVAGQRLNGAGILEPVDAATFWRLKSQLNPAPTNDYGRWVKWILADRSTKPISPSSSMVPESIKRDSGREQLP